MQAEMAMTPGGIATITAPVGFAPDLGSRVDAARRVERETAGILIELARAARDPQLRSALACHVMECREQQDRLADIAARIDAWRHAPAGAERTGGSTPRPDLPRDPDDRQILAALIVLVRREIAVYEALRLAAVGVGTVRALVDESLAQERERCAVLETMRARLLAGVA